MTKKKLAVIIGTRPEAIKLAPVIKAIEASGWAQCDLVLTGQHRDLVRPILDHFDLKAAHDLDVMLPNQALAEVTSRILHRFDQFLDLNRPDAVIGQGDTVSVLATSLAAFFRTIPFAHVEAGLRTGNRRLPFPEEMNRVLTTRLTDWHFAPTESARANLLAEGIEDSGIWVTGNTVIDALKSVIGAAPPQLPVQGDRGFVLITAHRRENHGEPMSQICEAIRILAARHPHLDFVFPMHPNPMVRVTVYKYLNGLGNVQLIEPCDYPVFCWLMKKSRLILTDSGGVQEEAPALGKPVLILRGETERPEAVEIGSNRLVGTETADIVAETDRLLSDPEAYTRMSRAGSPYGDGRASERIIDVLHQRLSEQRP